MGKSKLQALAEAFGIATEGLTPTQLQEALDANKGYQMVQAAEQKAEEAGSKVAELEGDLATANQQLSEKTSALDAAVEGKEAADAKVLELEAALTKANEQLAHAGNNKKPEGYEEGKTTFHYNNLTYGFNERAPQKLKIDGVFRTQEELLNDEEAMVSLIVGQSAFVKRIV